MKKLISIAFLLIGFTLNAQTISGVVYDVENANEPFLCRCLYQNGTKGTTTDFDGNYTLSLEVRRLHISG